MIVSEFIEWLKTIPQEAHVEVAVAGSQGSENYLEFEYLEVGEYSDNCNLYDFRNLGLPFHHPYHDKIILQLGRN